MSRLNKAAENLTCAIRRHSFGSRSAPRSAVVRSSGLCNAPASSLVATASSIHRQAPHLPRLGCPPNHHPSRVSVPRSSMSAICCPSKARSTARSRIDRATAGDQRTARYLARGHCLTPPRGTLNGGCLDLSNWHGEDSFCRSAHHREQCAESGLMHRSKERPFRSPRRRSKAAMSEQSDRALSRS